MKRILIADDSFYQRKVLSDLVTELGYEVEVVPSGEELLKRTVTVTVYDCVLLDLLMTGMSGIEVLQELKSRNDIPPIIVITADVQTARREECLALGAAAFMNKVVSQEALKETLDHVLN